MGKSPKDDEEPDSSMSDESVELLKKAAQGRPCKFVLASKSNSPTMLVCSKKGSADKLKKDAKTELADLEISPAGMTFTYGVVTKSEGALEFQLPASEGYKDGQGPVAPAKLIKYMKASGLPSYDARFKVVEQTPSVLDPSDPLVARFLKVRDAAAELAKKHPEHADRLNSLLAKIPQLLDADPSSNVAYGQIELLEKLVRAIAMGGPLPDAEAPRPKEDAPTPPIPPTPPPPAPPGSEQAKFQSRLADLIKKATPFVAKIGAKLKELATDARALATQKSHEKANALLDEIEKLIEDAAKPDDSEDRKEFMRRAGEIKSVIDKLKAAGESGDAVRLSELGALLRQAAEQAKRGEFGACFELLAKAEELAKLPVGSTKAKGKVGDDSDVKTVDVKDDEEESDDAASCLELWRGAKEEVDRQLNDLVKAMKSSGHPYLQKIAEFGLNGSIEDPGKVFVKLQAALMDFDRASGDARVAAAKKAASALAAYLAFVDGSKLIKVLDSSPALGKRTTIRRTFFRTLKKVEQRLQDAVA